MSGRLQLCICSSWVQAQLVSLLLVPSCLVCAGLALSGFYAMVVVLSLRVGNCSVQQSSLVIVGVSALHLQDPALCILFDH